MLIKSIIIIDSHAYGLIIAMPAQRMNIAQARSVHIPAHVQQAMDKHMQQTMPGNLKYYQQSGAYVPPHIQQAMAKHMQSSLPEHMKQYIDPYVQQSVVPQHLGSASAPQATHFRPQTSGSGLQTHELSESFHTKSSEGIAGDAPVGISEAGSIPTVQPPAVPGQPYDFITNPSVPTPKSPLLLSGKSLPIRIAIAGGGLVILIILFSIIKSLFTTSFDLPQFEAVLEDQKELIHLTTNATQSQGGQSLPQLYANFNANTQLTITSANNQTRIYLVTNKEVVPTILLNSRIHPSLDTQLTSAVANGNYTSLFSQIMSNQLNIYRSDLKQAYSATSGPHGKALLKFDYEQATILDNQLRQADTSSGN